MENVTAQKNIYSTCLRLMKMNLSVGTKRIIKRIFIRDISVDSYQYR